jgi:hypothetical protein
VSISFQQSWNRPALHNQRPTKKSLKVRSKVAKQSQDKVASQMQDGNKSMNYWSLVEQHNTDPQAAKHLSMDSMMCVGLHIQEESNIYVSVITTLFLLSPDEPTSRHAA